MIDGPEDFEVEAEDERGIYYHISDLNKFMMRLVFDKEHQEEVRLGATEEEFTNMMDRANDIVDQLSRHHTTHSEEVSDEH
jgi:hypothetical protein